LIRTRIKLAFILTAAIEIRATSFLLQLAHGYDIWRV